MEAININSLSPEQREKLLQDLSSQKAQDDKKYKEAYENLRADFISRVKTAVLAYIEQGKNLKEWLRNESEAFYEVMKEYGQLKRDDQISFSLSDGDFKFHLKGNKVKKFDERADIAEKRLVDFLNEYVAQSEKGVKDPMYKLAMMMIQRNEAGDLDYKSISRLYELEDDFNSPDYSSIMELFRQSNIVEGTVIHFYFEEKNKYNQWKKLEPSFNRI